jgi:hypothetical protein
MNRTMLIRFLVQTILISTIYGLVYSFGLYKLAFNLFITNLISVTFIFVVSGFILFFKLPEQKPIVERFLIMTMIQMLSILSLELAYIYSNQSLVLILNGLVFSLIHFLFQTIFLVRIQKN